MDLGLIHYLVNGMDDREDKVSEVLDQVRGCAAEGVAGNKYIMRLGLTQPRGLVIDAAAKQFSEAMRSEVAKEGVDAFINKRQPKWAIN